jgi:hypothetical protein
LRQPVGERDADLGDAGTLFRRQRAAEETLTQAQAQYRATVLTALQNWRWPRRRPRW